MSRNNKQLEYVIGIDLGHGETSAAICPIQWDEDVDKLEPVKDLELGNNKKVLPSAITILSNGNAYIGDAAFAPEILKQAHVHVCFKAVPKDMGGENEKLMMRFMKEVYNRIRQNNPAVLTDDNHLVYIATPSGWDKDSQALYLQMAKKAGLPMGGITKESRAAFVRAQNDVTSGIGRNLDKGAVVFDMGSSTLDFTFMKKNIPHLIDNGYYCGASFIEKVIFENKEKEDEAIRLFEQKYPDLVDFLVFEARKVKEQVFFDPTLKVKKTINFDDFIEDEELEDERFKLTFQPGELNALLEEKGYVNQVREALLDFRRHYIPKEKIYGVFMTGGASRMDFLKGLICECWDVKESQLFRDTDPSLTISQGVAEVARMDLRTEGMDAGIENAISQFQNSDRIYSTFRMKFGAGLNKQIVNDIQVYIDSFMSSQKDLSINALTAGISAAAQGAVRKVTANASAYLQEAVSFNMQDLQKQIENILKNYSKNDYSLARIDASGVRIPKLSDINLNDTLVGISNSIQASVSNLGVAIGGAAAGAVLAWLLAASGPIGWIIAGIMAGLSTLFFGKSDDEKKAEIEKRKAAELAKLRTKSEREQIVKKFVEEKWVSLETEIDASVRKALASDDNVKASINAAVKKLLDEYKDSLRNARQLID